jgi:alpha-tubulin suppressor-like RCC1 family protein
VLFVKVACGANYTIALSETNQLYSSGENDKGQLGLGHFKSTNILQAIPKEKFEQKTIEFITCFDACSAAITTDHTLFMWGNHDVQLACGLRLITRLISNLT